MSKLEMVEEFHRTFGHPIENKPVIPTASRTALRIELMQEELNEIEKAIEEGNPVEILDGLSDLIVVTLGTVLELGFKDVFDEAFERVHASNMSKACKTIEEAEATVKKYLKEGVTTYYEQVGEYYIVYRKKDNKILKSINYNKVDLEDLCM